MHCRTTPINPRQHCHHITEGLAQSGLRVDDDIATFEEGGVDGTFFDEGWLGVAQGGSAGDETQGKKGGRWRCCGCCDIAVIVAAAEISSPEYSSANILSYRKQPNISYDGESTEDNNDHDETRTPTVDLRHTAALSQLDQTIHRDFRFDL